MPPLFYDRRAVAAIVAATNSSRVFTPCALGIALGVSCFKAARGGIADGSWQLDVDFAGGIGARRLATTATLCPALDRQRRLDAFRRAKLAPA